MCLLSLWYGTVYVLTSDMLLCDKLMNHKLIQEYAPCKHSVSIRIIKLDFNVGPLFNGFRIG